MFNENSIISTIDELSLLTTEAIKILNNIELLSREINSNFKLNNNNIFDNYFDNIKKDIIKTNIQLKSYPNSLNNIIIKDKNNE